ncbi:hypothetical protein B0H11DRAFT_1901283 [Mycena galericulata]|nr:hypothetical protein B0H11DRAFT_1901283 [Mycena galericulata]
MSPASTLMPSSSESSASLLTALLPTSTTAKLVLTVSTLACMVYIVRAISPTRLMRVLVSSLAAAEHSYIQGVESGSFVYEYAALAKRLASLQIDVSILREEDMRDSLSHCNAFSRYFQLQRTFAILRCIREVRTLETDIEILKEGQLRELPLEVATAAAMRTISMRRRAAAFKF